MTHASVARDSSSRYSRLASQLFCLAALLILAVSVSGCAKLQARDLLNKGVAAFKSAQFDTAVEDFKRAKELDPDLINARLYLATAYASQYIPGAPSDENMRHGQEAVAEYREVLERPPTTSTPSMVSPPSSIKWRDNLSTRKSSKSLEAIT